MPAASRNESAALAASDSAAPAPQPPTAIATTAQDGGTGRSGGSWAGTRPPPSSLPPPRCGMPSQPRSVRRRRIDHRPVPPRGPRLQWEPPPPRAPPPWTTAPAARGAATSSAEKPWARRYAVVSAPGAGSGRGQAPCPGQPGTGCAGRVPPGPGEGAPRDEVRVVRRLGKREHRGHAGVGALEQRAHRHGSDGKAALNAARRSDTVGQPPHLQCHQARHELGPECPAPVLAPPRRTARRYDLLRASSRAAPTVEQVSRSAGPPAGSRRGPAHHSQEVVGHPPPSRRPRLAPAGPRSATGGEHPGDDL